MDDLDWVDILLHIPLAAVVYAAAMVSPALAVGLALLLREAAQKDLDFVSSLMIWKWSFQKHLEWVPQTVLYFVAEAVWLRYL